MTTVSIAATVLLGWAVAAAPPADDDEWIGERFMPREGCIVKNGDKSIPLERLVYPLVVSKVDGDRAWIGRGWVEKNQLVPWREAKEYFAQLVKEQPTSLSYFLRGVLRLERYDTEEAASDFAEALRLDEKNIAALAYRGALLGAQGDDEEAAKCFEEAIKLDSTCPVPYRMRAKLNDLRDPRQAIKDATRAIELEPEEAALYFERGNYHQRIRQTKLALADFESTVRLDPRHLSAYIFLAGDYASSADATLRNGKRAVECAKEACRLTNYLRPEVLGQLAAAYAETGDFDKAVYWQSKVLKAFGHGQEFLDRHRARLALYKAKQPYHRQQVIEIAPLEIE